MSSLSKSLFRVYCITVAALLLLAACGGQVEQATSTATPVSPAGNVYGMAAVKTSTPTADPAVTSTPRATNTRVLPQTPMATADPNRLTRADVPRIGIAEAKAKLDAGEAIMVDVRSAAAYEFSHIAGALSMPGTEVAQHIHELDKGKLIILYCA